jgi:hypothetical protein
MDVRLLISLPLAAVALASFASAPAAGAACGAETELRNFTVEAVPAKKTYRMNEVLKAVVTVTRPGPNDPATGEPWSPPSHEPVEGAYVGLNLQTSPRDLPVFGTATTDADGKAEVHVKLERGDPPRWVYAYASAELWHRKECPEVVERGGTAYEKFIKLED